MKPFINRILICLLPVLLAGFVVGLAFRQYAKGEGGFKLGVDLVGGTILVYEVDQNKKLPDNYKPEELAAALKRRIDPVDLLNITIRPLSTTRVEIILPTGGAHQAAIEEANWQQLLEAVRQNPKWNEQLKTATLDVQRGDLAGLTLAVQQDMAKAAWADLLADVHKQWPDKLKDVKLEAIPAGQQTDLREALKKAGIEDKEIGAFFEKAGPDFDAKLVKGKEVTEFLEGHYQTSGKKKDVTGEEVQRIKDLIAQVGSLEFRILANYQDDKEAIDAARAALEGAPDETPQQRADRKRLLETLAGRGAPPPPPGKNGIATPFHWSNQWGSGDTTYSWVELGRQERKSLNLDNAAEKDTSRNQRWQEVAKAREEGRAIVLPDFGQTLIFSRPVTNYRLPPAEQTAKKYEYFVLTRDPRPGEKITGQYLVSAQESTDNRMQPAVSFRFNNQGGNLFYETTSMNRPTGGGAGGDAGRTFRHLAIILDDQIVSAPRLNEAIRYDGQISGNFTAREVEQLVSILRAGALPATLKPLPVSENTIGPTLGSDTIRSGLWSVLASFVAVLAFMVVYYRFAGMVACIALFASLLLTVAFMVMVNATFTLPGIAGLVLTIGMAVDANVLIYERLREERDRGASLALAIRNGYDRSFGTIIDTHLSSIVTAVILYAVGNDQLKGFAISLTAGLVISLFTSLYMTRLIFDIGLSKGWLRDLKMFRLFAKPNIDFMRVRNYWFAATVSLTIIGGTVFLVRGSQGLNIDFVGGTAYGAQLKEPASMTMLRQLVSEANQHERLRVERVEEDLASDGKRFSITFAGDGPEGDRTFLVALPNKAEGATREEREKSIAERASSLPDVAVEQIFLSSEPNTGGATRFFTVRSSEKAPELVQVAVFRLFNEGGTPLLKQVLLNKFEVTNQGRQAQLEFSEEASPGQVRMLLDREADKMGVPPEKVSMEIIGEGRGKEGRFQNMRLEVSGVDAAKIMDADKLAAILTNTKAAFEARPQPERLENFDSQLAAETQSRALYAILASWAALLFYIWFRFGNWTFGLAAILCLVHDVVFTLGLIAFCHYIYEWLPPLAYILLIQDFKIDLPTVAALLTLVGYSINDKIVVYDRMREVRGKKPELTAEIINESINQALSRTVLTGLSVMLVLLVLYIFGGEGIHLFAFVMLIGLIVGTYSSIYVASPLLLLFGEGKTFDTKPAAAEKASEEEGEGEGEGEGEEEEEEVGK